jgi:hypothetical protein
MKKTRIRIIMIIPYFFQKPDSDILAINGNSLFYSEVMNNGFVSQCDIEALFGRPRRLFDS